MKKFIIKSSLFSIPFLVYFVVIVLFDPYNYFNISGLISKETKIETSKKINPVIWKVIDFKNNPSPNILLGDSRMDNINIEKIDTLTNAQYFNFAYGGSTLKEVIDTFWYATEHSKIKNVYIGVNFNLYNANNINSRFDGAVGLVENPLLYMCNYNILQSLYYNVAVTYFNEEADIGNPNMSRSDFWKFQLDFTTKRYYSSYKYPKKYFEELGKISKYCKENNIKLVFIIFPTHTDLQNLIKEFNLENENMIFQKDIESIATTYNFDYENSMTKDEKNFKDPFHYQKEFGDLIVEEIWGSKPKQFAKYSNM